ncbi:MAG: ACT domain-containing protein, partial [Muribaculaceae bacterium]|nr:ACT domain-containing protein [Muribaculaceae bacterium]
VAAVMFDKLPVKGKKTVCLVSGGNIDVSTLNRVITRGLVKSGRTHTFIINLPDKPGQLSGVCNVIAENGGNVISVNHERTNGSNEITGCTLRIDLETRNHEHIEKLRKSLVEAGFNVID